MKKMADEKKFENKIKDFLQLRNCWFVKFFANSFTKKGVPDLLACVNGYFVAIEVKAENGRASDLQKLNIDRIRCAGGVAVILRPSQFDDFKKLIDKLLKLDRQKVNYLLESEVFRNLYGLKED